MNKLVKYTFACLTLLATITLSACASCSPVGENAPDTASEYPYTYQKIYDDNLGYIYRVSAYDATYSGDSLTIGGEINELPISSVGGVSFRRSETIKSIEFGDSVKIIEASTFISSSVQTVVLPSAIYSLGDNAFNSCASLTHINLGNTSLTRIPNGAFYKCTSLTSITIPKTATSIGEYAFEGCTAIKTVYIPRSVTSLAAACLKSLYVANDGVCTIYYEGSKSEWDAIHKEVSMSYAESTAGETMYWYGMGDLLYEMVYNYAM